MGNFAAFSLLLLEYVYQLLILFMARKKLNRHSLHARVAPDTPDKIKQIAFNLGFVYDGEGSTGQLLDAIANSEIALISKNTFSKVVDSYSKVEIQL